jgi:hypothetical protein
LAGWFRVLIHERSIFSNVNPILSFLEAPLTIIGQQDLVFTNLGFISKKRLLHISDNPDDLFFA